jgi:putative cardiolipin synthase
MGAKCPFEANNNFNYRDLDVVGIGPVAGQVSTEFDTYWNASETIPVTAFVKPEDSVESSRELKKRFEKSLQKAKTTPYADALDSTIGEILLSNVSDKLVWAPAQIVNDLPYGESTQKGKSGEEVLAGLLISAVEKATEEWYLISPYFVPGKTGIQLFRQLRERGVHCVVVTNSLASTDVSAVYGGYNGYQKPLLELGVELWEMMAYPDLPANKRGVSTDRQSLHAKTFSIDNKQLFVGSFNWDPRSRGINTEMGVLIESSQLAGLLKKSVSTALPGNAWQLRLNSLGDVEWVDVIKGKEFIYTKPPQASLWKRFNAWISGLDAIEGQL